MADGYFYSMRLCLAQRVASPKQSLAPLQEASQRLNAAVNEVLKEANVLKEFRTLGYEPVGGSGAQFQAWVKSEQDKWGKVIKFANIKTD